MPILSRRAYRYARAWLAGPSDAVSERTTLDRAGTAVEATVVRPRAAPAPLPGWVVLHGMTRAGRAHPQLVRFTHALVSTGTVAIVPEVPEWRALDLAPDLATPTVAAAIAGLRETGWARDAPVSVIGFSFGAPHAIASAADPALASGVARTVGFGGYCDIRTAFRFMMTGRHEWGGREIRVRPDPYARWIVAANYLAEIPGHHDAADVAEALRALAAYTGDVGTPSWDPVHDPVIADLRRRVAPERRRLFDLFAPPSAAVPDEDAAAGLVEGLAAAAERTDPLIDPRPRLARVERPVHILHGWNDVLIPCSEARRLREAVPATTRCALTVTRLFGHSSQDPFPGGWASVREVPRFARALSGMLADADR